MSLPPPGISLRSCGTEPGAQSQGPASLRADPAPVRRAPRALPVRAGLGTGGGCGPTTPQCLDLCPEGGTRTSVGQARGGASLVAPSILAPALPSSIFAPALHLTPSSVFVLVSPEQGLLPTSPPGCRRARVLARLQPPPQPPCPRHCPRALGTCFQRSAQKENCRGKAQRADLELLGASLSSQRRSSRRRPPEERQDLRDQVWGCHYK